MDLGVRQIRTAGKGSGSIELTLPADLRALVGLPCRIMLRDGSRPDIVLQPDLRGALSAFSLLWTAMAGILLRQDADPPSLPLPAFSFGLQPRAGGGGLPFLCWRDGLALAASPPYDPATLARTIAAFGLVLASDLEIAPALAAGFGAACGYLLCGAPANADGQEACDLAAAALHRTHQAQAPLASIEGALDDDVWHRAAPLLIATADLFAAWTADPAAHIALRAAWRRGRTIEMSGDPMA
jgi:hypothetical protein